MTIDIYQAWLVYSSTVTIQVRKTAAGQVQVLVPMTDGAVEWVRVDLARAVNPP